MFGKILVPTDGSEESQKALQMAISLAKKYESKVIVLYVVSLNTHEFADLPTISVELSQQWVGELKNIGIQVIDNIKQTVSFDGVEYSTLLELGNPAVEICKVAKNENIDLIVMGSRGLGSFGKIIIGSVSNKVLQLAECPVLITRK
jgi:nucleotide-binding universal stress UspA family protein